MDLKRCLCHLNAKQYVEISSMPYIFYACGNFHERTHLSLCKAIIFVMLLFFFFPVIFLSYGNATTLKGNDCYAMYKIYDATAAAATVSMRNANIRFRSINRKCAAYFLFCALPLVSYSK